MTICVKKFRLGEISTDGRKATRYAETQQVAAHQ